MTRAFFKIFSIIFILQLLLTLNVRSAQALEPTGVACDPASPTCGEGEICTQRPGDSGPMCYLTSGEAFQNVQRNAVRNYFGGETIESETGALDAVRDSAGDWFNPMASNGGPTVAMNYISYLYKEKPASSAEYIADLKRNWGFPVKTAYAQGYAFTALNPILPLWKLTRNLALAGFVLVFIIIGIMIILRSKIDPRTVITIQQAIPKIVIALILVIFSYAIIGLLVDSITIITRLGATLLQQQNFIAAPVENADRPDVLNRLLDANVFLLFSKVRDMDSTIAAFANLDDDLGIIANILKFDAVGGGGVTKLVLWIALFVAMIRTFFLLLTTYLRITITIILSPLQFLLFAIPGQGGGFGTWFRNLMSNLLVFPTVFFMLAFAAIFMSMPGSPTWFQSIGSETPTTTDNVWQGANAVFDGTQNYWVAPALGNWGIAVGPLLSLGVVLTIPGAATIVKETLQAKSSKAEGEAGASLQKAAGRIPILGSFTR